MAEVNKLYFSFFILSSLLIAILDTVTIGAIIPFYYKYSTGSDKKEILINGILIIGIFFILKSVLGILITYFQNWFIYGTQSKITTSFFSKLINKKLEFFVSNDHSKILNFFSRDIELTITCLINISVLITELLIIIIILFIILFFQPETFVNLLAIILIIYGLHKLIIDSLMKKLGVERSFLSQKASQIYSEAFSAIKEILIYKNNNYFNGLLLLNQNKVTKNNIVMNSLSQAPKQIIELTFMICICLFIYMNINQDSIEELIAILGFFMLSAMRLMPSFSRILNAKSNILYGIQSLNNLCDAYWNNSEFNIDNKKKNLYFSKQIELKNIRYSIGDRIILNNINLTINKNQSVVIIGKSGSGKTSLIDILSGLITPTSGVIEVDGINIIGYEDVWAAKVAYMPQFPYLIKGTIEENIIFGDVSPINEKRLKNVSEIVQINNNIHIDLGKYIEEKANNVSGGQRQRIAIARALYKNSEVLILDEITSGLDEETGLNIIKNILYSNSNKTIIYITHNLNHVPLFDKKYDIDEFNQKVLN